MNRTIQIALAAVVVGIQAVVVYRLVVLERTITKGMRWLGDV